MIFFLLPHILGSMTLPSDVDFEDTFHERFRKDIWVVENDYLNCEMECVYNLDYLVRYGFVKYTRDVGKVEVVLRTDCKFEYCCSEEECTLHTGGHLKSVHSYKFGIFSFLAMPPATYRGNVVIL